MEKTKLSLKCINDFYNKLIENNIENHGLLIMKDEEIIYEKYQYPYSAQIPHTLFSVTKSIVSTAVGFAVDEGLLSLSDKITDIFPEYKRCKSDKWEKVTLRSVLTMQSNKSFSFLQDMTGNYVEMFMKAPFRKKEGFLYSNNDAHIAAAAVQKVSGMNLADYLMPRLFEPLGIDKPFWETNEIGECIGGTGCYLKLRDLAKIMQCYGNGGRFAGHQIVPSFWVEEATKIQVDFGNGNGYGYLFWINGDIFSMTGMFSQIIAFSKKHNAVIASLNCGIKEEMHTKLLQDVLVKCLEEDDGEFSLEEEAVNEAYNPVNFSCVPVGRTFEITHFSDVLAKIIFPQSVIPRTLSCSFAKRPKSNLNKIHFGFDGEDLKITWQEEEDTVVIKCNRDGTPSVSSCSIKGYEYKLWAYAFNEADELKIVLKAINTLSTQYISFRFFNNFLKVKFVSTPSFAEFIMRNVESPEFFRKNPGFAKIILKPIEKFMLLTERYMKFKIR